MLFLSLFYSKPATSEIFQLHKTISFSLLIVVRAMCVNFKYERNEREEHFIESDGVYSCLLS